LGVRQPIAAADELLCELKTLGPELKRLGPAMVDWRPGCGGVSVNMIPQAGAAMIAAAAKLDMFEAMLEAAADRARRPIAAEMLEPLISAPEGPSSTSKAIGFDPESYQERVEPPRERVAA
jgi:hypothetical protein